MQLRNYFPFIIGLYNTLTRVLFIDGYGAMHIVNTTYKPIFITILEHSKRNQSRAGSVDQRLSCLKGSIVLS